MNRLKKIGTGILIANCATQPTNDFLTDILFAISILITIIGMIQDELNRREKKNEENNKNYQT